MRVAVASTYVPFLRGGGVQIVSDLVGALRERDHEVDTIMLPFHTERDLMLEQMVGIRLYDVTASVDRLICIRTPSYLLRHPSKVVWFIHHHRGAYDLWGTEFGDIEPTAAGRRLRDAVQQADEVGLAEAQRLYTNSRVVGQRLRDYNGMGSEVLYPPLPSGLGYRNDGYGDYIFYPSRMTAAKRQGLLIEAMAHVTSDVRAVIAGNPEESYTLSDLEALIDRLGVRDRVELRGEWISQDEKERLMAGALACAYIPFDEDSYGYVSLEAYQSGKAVVTCSDSGGSLELIEDGVSGLVADPTPAGLAAALDRLGRDADLARRMGEAGAERMEALGISWDRVVDKLLA